MSKNNPKFIVLKHDYPHGSCTNRSIDIAKGTVMECPSGFKAHKSAFETFTSESAAQEYADSYESEPPQSKGLGYQSFPLFRRVTSPGGKTELKLFDADLVRFLNREWTDILLDFQSIDLDERTVDKLVTRERNSLKRPEVLTYLENMQVALQTKGITTSIPGFTKGSLNKSPEAREEEAKVPPPPRASSSSIPDYQEEG